MAAGRSKKVNGTYLATAYSVSGITASGESTHRHVVAADPALLPIGSRIKIRRAGKYSGEYVVADTGEKIVGRRLDIYMPHSAECKKFGKRSVRVRVVSLGAGNQADAKNADREVKRDVAIDVAKGTVGNAATEVDWANQSRSDKAAAVAKASGASTTGPAQNNRPSPQ